MKWAPSRSIIRFNDAIAIGLTLAFLWVFPSHAAEPPAAEEGPAEKSAVEKTSGAPLDVTITGEAKDEVPVEKQPPALEIPFEKLVSLSREGQTEQTLSDEVRYMIHEEQLKLVEFDSSQTIRPLPVRIPQPPFFQMEVPAGLTYVRWDYRVVDHNGNILVQRDGATLPGTFLEWDGMQSGVFRVLAGPAYTPILTLISETGAEQRFYGDPLQLFALNYEKNGWVHIEFDNEKIYDRRTDKFSEDAYPLIEATLNLLRPLMGNTFQLTVYEDTKAQSLASKRVELWRDLLKEKLLIEDIDLKAQVQGIGERGRVTQFIVKG